LVDIPQIDLDSLLKSPDNTDIKIWRYISFTKFVSLLDSRSLYFARSDLLGDPWEGSYPILNILKRTRYYENKYGKNIPKGFLANMRESMSALEMDSYYLNWIRKWTFISCWHMNENESAALWKLYSSSNEVVAIQSKYYILKNNIPDSISIGEVKYIDYNEAVITDQIAIWPFFHKRMSFSHEKELRALIQDPPIKDDLSIDVTRDNPDTGRYISVDLDSIIENVYIAPSSPTWFHGIVEKVMDKYKLRKDLHKSSLDADPVF